jgi:hypothetical protein
MGRHCAAIRSRKSLAVVSVEPGRDLMKTIFLFGCERLLLILSQPSTIFSFKYNSKRRIVAGYRFELRFTNLWKSSLEKAGFTSRFYHQADATSRDNPYTSPCKLFLHQLTSPRPSEGVNLITSSYRRTNHYLEAIQASSNHYLLSTGQR